MSKFLSLSKLLKNKKAMHAGRGRDFSEEIKKLQLKMLRVQQGVWHNKDRLIIAFEGFDAAGKGGAIRTITEGLDPRGFRVHPIGPPATDEQGRHWLYRFWRDLPRPGTIAIFDRSWYGRVLVERVDKLIDKKTYNQAYEQINQFEEMLRHDGITIIKIFLAISKKEQLKRFEERLEDPYKQWKLSIADLKARKKWDDYVEAVDDAFHETDTKKCPWHLIAADEKPYARFEALKAITSKMHVSERWMEKKAAKLGKRNLKAALQELES